MLEKENQKRFCKPEKSQKEIEKLINPDKNGKLVSSVDPVLKIHTDVKSVNWMNGLKGRIIEHVKN